jgi:hypothetical protein
LAAPSADPALWRSPRASPDQVRGIVLVGAKASVRRDPVAREVIVRALQDDGIHAALQPGVAGGRYEHVVVEDCGHYVPLERPDMFYAVLTDQISHMQQA